MKQKLVHYLTLTGILAAGVAAFFLVRPNATLELFVGSTTAVAYVLWGIIYHAIRRDLHPKIVIEYVLIGAIAVVLLVTMLGF